MKALRVLQVVLCFALLNQFCQADSPSGQVVWWGKVVSAERIYSEHTNGVIEIGSDRLSNVVTVAVRNSQGLALKNDGTIIEFGNEPYPWGKMPAGLSNVVSISLEGGSAWAIRRDGTVVRWGADEDEQNVVAGLTNVTAIAWAGYRSYLALKTDGTLVGMRLDNPAPVLPVRVRGQVLRNVVGVASMDFTPMILKADGTVLRLGFQTPGRPPAEPIVTQAGKRTIAIDMGGESRKTPYDYTSADPVMVGGNALSNVAALTCGGGHCLALARNGTVVAWGNNSSGESTVPADLCNVSTIAAGWSVSLALKKDGTVVAWGSNANGQTSVPAGLSNVVAIASDGMVSLAVTTGSIPPTVFVQPHGRLEEMDRQADLIFKGQVLSTEQITNAAFRVSDMSVHATKLKVISTIKGVVPTNLIVFQHYSGWLPGGHGWSGAHPPAFHQMEPGKSYLIFAAKTDKPDKYYAPPPGHHSKPEVFRQIADFPIQDDEGVLHTLDARPLSSHSVKDAHWIELNLLLREANTTNQLYALKHLDWMSKTCAHPWGHSDDFKREAVLKTVLPFATNANDHVAVSAISLFDVGGNHVDLIGDLGGPQDGWMPSVAGCERIRKIVFGL